MFMPMDVVNVAAISVPVPRTALRMASAIRPSMPAFSITAPKVIAAMMSHTVFNMPAIPPRDKSSSSAALPDVSSNPFARACQHPLRSAAQFGSSGDAASVMTAPAWNMTAKTHPVSVPITSAGVAGIFRTTRTSTSTTGSSRCGPITKLPLRDARIALTAAVSCGAAVVSPITVNKPRAIRMLGVVVHAMWRMWVNRSVPAMAGARLVVSDSGDILSPK
jgi:hypothetical protein